MAFRWFRRRWKLFPVRKATTRATVCPTPSAIASIIWTARLETPALTGMFIRNIWSTDGRAERRTFCRRRVWVRPRHPASVSCIKLHCMPIWFVHFYILNFCSRFSHSNSDLEFEKSHSYFTSFYCYANVRSIEWLSDGRFVISPLIFWSTDWLIDFVTLLVLSWIRKTIHLLYQLLRYYGYYVENLPGGDFTFPEYGYRLRQVEVYFHMDDDTISVFEPHLENSGLPQGITCRRRQYFWPGTDLTCRKPYVLTDFKLGNDYQIAQYKIHLYDADDFTKVRHWNHLLKLESLIHSWIDWSIILSLLLFLHRSIDCSIVGLIDWLINWLIDWLID